MARIRTVKPEFWTAEQVMELSRDARLLFIGLWNFCDDAGVHPAAYKTLKAEVFPGDDVTAANIQAMVSEILNQGLLVEFEHEGRRWWHVTGWKHQLINRPTPSRYPKPPRSAPLPLAAGRDELPDAHAETNAECGNAAPERALLTEDSLRTHGVLTEHPLQEWNGRERIGKECGEQAAAAIPSREAAAALPAENSDVSPIDPVTERAAEIATMLRKRGARLQSSDPRVRAWASNGITDAAVLTALETAQERRLADGAKQPVNAGLLDAIISDACRIRAGPRRTIHDDRKATLDELTGRTRNGTTDTTRDITAEVVRIA